MILTRHLFLRLAYCVLLRGGINKDCGAESFIQTNDLSSSLRSTSSSSIPMTEVTMLRLTKRVDRRTGTSAQVRE